MRAQRRSLTIWALCLTILDVPTAQAAAMFAGGNGHRHQPKAGSKEFCRHRMNHGAVIEPGIHNSDLNAIGTGQQQIQEVGLNQPNVLDVMKRARIGETGAVPAFRVINFPEQLGETPQWQDGKLIVRPTQLFKDDQGVPSPEGVGVVVVRATDPLCPQNGFLDLSFPMRVGTSGLAGQIAPPASGATAMGNGASPKAPGEAALPTDFAPVSPSPELALENDGHLAAPAE